MNIYSDPWAKIYINGKETEYMTPVNNIQIPIGRHQIKLVNPDSTEYRVREMEVVIRENKTTKLSVIKDRIRITQE